MLYITSAFDDFTLPLPLQARVGSRSYDLEVKEEFSSQTSSVALRWWHRLGTPLRVFLEAAGYTRPAITRHLKSFASITIPHLGGGAAERASFMTDNGCPMELSWDWGWDGCSPSVRYSIEPLSLPYPCSAKVNSREVAGFNYWVRLSTKFDLPPDVFRYFWDGLVVSSTDESTDSALVRSDDRSQFFAGFDIDNTTSIFKAYFLPTLQAQAQGRTKYDLIKSVLEQSPGWWMFAAAFATIDDFMVTSSLSSQVDAEIFSLDVRSASPSRYKLYVRCHTTTFASVREVVSLGGRLTSPALDLSLEQLHGLWLTLFQPGCVCDECPLQSVDHRTAGILYYFEFFAGKPVSTPKVYLPVRHYAPNDAHVERIVNAFVTKQAKVVGDDASRSTRRFRAALEKINGAQSIENMKGIHTYIGCTLEGGKVKLISYINPGFSHK